MRYQLRPYEETGANERRGLAPGHWCDAVAPYVPGCLVGPYASESEAVAACVAALKERVGTGNSAYVVRAVDDDRAKAWRKKPNGRDALPKPYGARERKWHERGQVKPSHAVGDAFNDPVRNQR